MEGFIIGDQFFDFLGMRLYSVKTGHCVYGESVDKLVLFETVNRDGTLYLRFQNDDKGQNGLRDNEFCKTSQFPVANYTLIGDDESVIACAEMLRMTGFSQKISLICKDLPYSQNQFYLKSFWVSESGDFEDIHYLRSRDYLKNVLKINLIEKDWNDLMIANRKIGLEKFQKLDYKKMMISSRLMPSYPKITGLGLENVHTAADLSDFVEIRKKLYNRDIKEIAINGNDIST